MKRRTTFRTSLDQLMANNKIPKPFNLLRWFSIASFIALLPVAGATGIILSHFLTDETLQRDASLTAQFIQSCIEVENQHAKLGANLTFTELLDERVDPRSLGVSQEAADEGREYIFSHLSSLPDVLLTSVFARDGRIIWSTNPSLIGTVATDNDELKEAFRSSGQVARHHATSKAERSEQKFVVEPKEFFIENYIPLYNAKGEAALVAEVYKEPKHLIASIERGRMLVWGTTLASGGLAYLAVFAVVRRGSALLQAQQSRLIENDSLVLVGEMSTAVAHGLRNPLANIRSSAELAVGTDNPEVDRSLHDIIKQVDYLSGWIHEILLFSRPLNAEPEAVDLVASLRAVLESFAAPFEKAGISLHWDPPSQPLPRVQGNTSLISQSLHSVLANALEATRSGDTVTVRLDVDERRGILRVVVNDTGVGMTPEQLGKAFKPFYTTKRTGTGVGLAIVKRVMDRFGGSIALSSTFNAGTEVRLEFKTA